MNEFDVGVPTGPSAVAGRDEPLKVLGSRLPVTLTEVPLGDGDQVETLSFVEPLEEALPVEGALDLCQVELLQCGIFSSVRGVLT